MFTGMFTAGQADVMFIFMIFFFGFWFTTYFGISLYKENKKLFIAYHVGLAIFSSLFAFALHPHDVLYYIACYFILLLGSGFICGLIFMMTSCSDY